MGGVESAKEAPKAEDIMGDMMPPKAEELKSKEKPPTGAQLTAVFDKINNFDARKKAIRSAETKTISKVVKLEKKIRPLKVEEDKLYEQIKSAKGEEKEALNEQLEELKKKLDPLRLERGKLTTAYQAKFAKTIMPAMKTKIKSGGADNVALLSASLKAIKKGIGTSNPSATALSNELHDKFNNGKASEGGLGGDFQKVSDDLFEGKRSFIAFKARVDAIDGAFTAAASSISSARA